MTMAGRRNRGAAPLLAALVLSALTLLLPPAVQAERLFKDRPYWSFEVKGGYFYPEFDSFPGGKTWSDFYGDDKTWQASASLAYKVLRQVEIGIEGGKIEDRGAGHAPLNDITTGRVIYQLFPASAFVVLRGVFSEEQWLVPYVGGGYTRMFYRQKIEDQGYTRGSVNGYHGRAGLQLLLDNADRKSADTFYLNYGIFHTYIFFEAQITKATINSLSGQTVDLGGVSYLGGLLFEF